MKTTRALIAFAYVADQFAKTNDIAQGLVPLFAPLISARAGTAFDPIQFTKDVKKTYDLDMHPYVAEQFAPALARNGYLEEDRRAGTVHYRNLESELPEPPVREEQLRALVDGFGAFAKPRLANVGQLASPEELEKAFFDRLIRPEFLALVLRPDGPSRGVRTLKLKSGDEQVQEEFSHTEQHFDYLVASYMLHLYQKSSDQFDLLVAATSGSLVSEVVLDLQHPLTEGEPLSGVRIAVDSPLVLDALGLGLEGAIPYARQLIEQIKTAGAVPVVFDGTVEEIRRVLRAPLQHYERGEDVYGPLGRRLRFNSTVAPYVRSIIPKVGEEIQELGIEIHEVSTTDRAERRKYFTETKERDLGNSLGLYPTEDARQHDARAIADVLRIRGQEEVGSIGQARIVFVTRNIRLARLTRQFLSEHTMISRDYFPPCITDRYLAGLLWISSGGGGDSLSRLRLVANCSAATVPRRELVSRMHKFFERLNPAFVSRFEALMTNERAEHFLMDRTLSDATLITQDNYEEIYRDIEEAAAERVTARKDQEIAEITERVAHLENSAREAAERAERLSDERTGLQDQLEESNRRWVTACLNAGRRAGLRAWGLVVLLLAILAAVASLLGGDDMYDRAIIAALTFFGTLVASLVGNRFWPENPVESWIIGRRDKAAIAYARRHKVEGLLANFKLDWENKTVVRKDEQF